MTPPAFRGPCQICGTLTTRVCGNCVVTFYCSVACQVRRHIRRVALGWGLQQHGRHVLLPWSPLAPLQRADYPEHQRCAKQLVDNLEPLWQFDLSAHGLPSVLALPAAAAHLLAFAVRSASKLREKVLAAVGLTLLDAAEYLAELLRTTTFDGDEARVE